MTYPIISIIIPTYPGSQNILDIALRGIANQKCSRRFYEVIIVDNKGLNLIKELAHRNEVRILEVDGEPSQACRQINLGVKKARGEYILLLDHDMELTPKLILNFLKVIKKRNNKIDAWYIPYKIIARGKFLNRIRNFEQQFYENSIIAAPRLISKKTFLLTENQYDLKFNLGPADWDFTNQLKLVNAKFGYLKDFVIHHEEGLTFWRFLSKKIIYAQGGELYKNKWRKKNLKIYNDIIKRQYDFFYRLFWIFLENGKWRKLIKNLHLYFLLLIIRISMAAIYLLFLVKKRYIKAY